MRIDLDDELDLDEESARRLQHPPQRPQRRRRPPARPWRQRMRVRRGRGIRLPRRWLLLWIFALAFALGQHCDTLVSRSSEVSMTWEELLERPTPRRGEVEPGNPSTLKLDPVEPPAVDPDGGLVEPDVKPKADPAVKLKAQVMG